MSLLVLDIVGLGLIQDQGRRGFYDIGVTVGGAMDMDTHNMANCLLNNVKQAATIELSLAIAKFKATETMRLCVCGAESNLTVNGQKQALWQTFVVQAGDEIEIHLPQKGCRCYLAVAGGFDTPIIFASRSTVVREKLGGFDGAPLRRGDELIIGNGQQGVPQLIKNRQYNQDSIPQYPSKIELRVVLGYQQDSFSNVEKRLFFSSVYEVSQHSDRMGYRLNGHPIACDSYKLVSEGICLGAIQIPADGQPIVLMRDRQTIGGYPKIGVVLSIDLNKLAQATPGCKVYFHPITIEDAHNALHLHRAMTERRLKLIKTLSQDNS